MNPELSLIGDVTVGLIRRALNAEADAVGTAKFVLQGISPPVILAIVSKVVADPDLSSRLEICLPRSRYGDMEGVDPAHLTTEKPANLRHGVCAFEGRLIAPADDTQDQTLAQLDKLDAEVLLDEKDGRAALWIEAACEGLALPSETLDEWQAALTGLLRTNRADLQQVAAFTAATAEHLSSGATLLAALGRSLSALRLPRHDGLFEEVVPAKRRWPSEWRKRFDAHWRRDCYLHRRDRQQLPLPPRPRLHERLAEISETLRDEVRIALEAYIDADDGDEAAVLALFAQNWPELEAFFEDVPRTEGKSLGQLTYDFFDIRAPELLTDEDREYLDAFRSNRRKAKNEDDDRFFAAHAGSLREDPRLAAQWERFIFGQKVECRDLIHGLARCLQRIRKKVDDAPAVLVVEGLERTPAHFLSLNRDVCQVFAARYRGLAEVMAGLVEFRHVPAFDYPAEILPKIESNSRWQPRHEKPRARRLGFKVWFETPPAEGRLVQKSEELRLEWEFDLKGIGAEAPDDIERLLTNKPGTPLVQSVAGRPKGDSRQLGAVQLQDLSSLEPTTARQAGALVPSASRCHSLEADWRLALTEMRDGGLIDQAASERVSEAFERFKMDYQTALEDYRSHGGAADSITRQAESYGELLACLTASIATKGPLARLLKPVLEIGVASILTAADAPPAVIICPWHPLRLAAQSARWRFFAVQLRRLLGPEPWSFTDSGGLYFKELQRALAEPLRPDVAVGWTGFTPEVLTRTDAHDAYSLHEAAVSTRKGSVRTGENVTQIAAQIGEIVRNYLNLQPHERDNLSVVLYDCDAAALPAAVVANIQSEAQRDGGEAMCSVVLKHREEGKLQDLYQQLVLASPEDDALHASEATRDFLARLRISIMVDEGPAVMSAEGPPLDIVFCHDVVSRLARLAWVEVPDVCRPPEAIDPGHWSRRRPVQPGDVDATVYLTCPVQPREGWRYLDALAALNDILQARRSRETDCHLIPARQTNMEDAETRKVLEETHRLGSWVVNFDDLLDRRQLAANQVRIIRYKHAATGGRNLVISSKAPDSLLRATLRSRLSKIDPAYTPAELAALSGRLIDDANRISGDIVLRAAKRGANANELVGVVLSRFLVNAELQDEPGAWFFLDDYASWLGQDEKRIADLLCLAPAMVEGEPVLRIVVTEAKFVAAGGMPKAAKDSSAQLADTLGRLETALSPDAAPLDRDIWLARLSDMLLDGLAKSPEETEHWRERLRGGGCRIDLRGYSHVFGHAPPEMAAPPESKLVGLPNPSGLQEQFGPDALRAILRRYHERGDPGDLREDRPTRPAPQSPAPEVPATSPHAAPHPAHPSGPREGVAGPDEPSALTPNASTEAAGTADAPDAPRPSSRFQALLEYKALGASHAVDAAWLEEVSAQARNAFLRYGMSARLEVRVLTPNAALLKFKGSDDLTVASIERRRTELETTHGLEVMSVRAEPGKVVVSIRRPDRQVLTLPEVWRHWATNRNGPNTRLLIAVKEDDAEPLFLEPDPTPHTLVAGSTGSGKSVLIQNILLGIAATNLPSQARIVLIDPKSGVDYFPFESLPHLDGGIIDDSDVALERLDGLVAEMERRYSLFKAARVSNIRGYNQKAAEPLPMIWLVHDEFADWMQIDDYRTGVEAAVSRLGVKARAAGIYLIFAAQRPDNTVFPMQLRSNLGNRLILRVDSAGTSDLSLGLKGGGAERLLGKGHLAAVIGGGGLVYAQCPYVDEVELQELVDALVLDLDARR